MSENKRKRSEDHYEPGFKAASQLQSQNQPAVSANPILQQPIILNPVVTHGEQFGEAEQIHLLNGSLATNQNAQSNLVYIILPPGVNQSQNVIQGVPTLLLMQKGDQANPSESPPQLHYYVSPNEKATTELTTKVEEDDDVIFVKDVRTVKADDEQEEVYLPDPETDPLQLQVVNTVHQGNNVSFTLVPQYEEIQQPPPPAEDIFVLDGEALSQGQPVDTSAEAMKWKTQFKCDYPGCIVTFPSLYEKKIHADTHIFPANTEFKCSICGMLFDRAPDRNKHVDSHSIVNTYKCKTCIKTFPYYTSLVKHMNEEKCAVTKSFSCHFCGVQFVDAKDLEKHQKLNMRLCACRAKICSDQAFELHTSLCIVYKQKMSKTKGGFRKKKSNSSSDVIVLD